MRVTESPLRDLLRLLVWYPLRLVVERLPVRIGLGVLFAMGRLHEAVSRGRRDRLARAVARVAPGLAPGEARRQVGESFRTHYANQLCIFLFPRLTRETLGALLEIAGLEHLDAALARGRGAVMPIGHFGPGQLSLAGLGLLGYPMLQIGYQNDNKLTFIGKYVSFRLRLRYEDRIPARIVPPGPGTRQALVHLRAGGVVMTTADNGPGQPAFGRHATFPFPGGTITAPLGPARLALAGGAALVPGFLVPGESAPYRLRIEAPIGPPPGRGRDEAALAMTGEFLERYGRVVAENPGWWHPLEEAGGGWE